MQLKILVTGAAGFIGSQVMQELAKAGCDVTGIDNINDYYAEALKFARLQRCGFRADEASWPGNICQSSLYEHCHFIRMSIDDSDAMQRLFDRGHFDKVVNLAAQAGVRYSIENPFAYMHSNMDGFLNVLECCRHHDVKHLIFASSSSVYGLCDEVPFREDFKTDTPVSLYAASKKSDELMAFAYSKLYGLTTTGLRYFTVYGPWGRPDMAPMLFANAISKGETIKVFNHGDMIRDFTYIDDIVKGTLQVIFNGNIPSFCEKGIPHRVYNIGCSKPVKLMDFINELEQALGKKANKQMLPMQPGDVYETYADTSRLEREIGYKPQVTLHEGIGRFIRWYLSDENVLLQK